MINQEHGRKYYWKCCGTKIAVTPAHVKTNKYKKCSICNKSISETEKSKATTYLVVRRLDGK